MFNESFDVRYQLRHLGARPEKVELQVRERKNVLEQLQEQEREEESNKPKSDRRNERVSKTIEGKLEAIEGSRGINLNQQPPEINQSKNLKNRMQPVKKSRKIS